MEKPNACMQGEDPIHPLLMQLSVYAQEKNVGGIISLYHPSATSFEFGAQDSAIEMSANIAERLE